MESQNTFLSLMTGKLLGDGCITQQKGRKARFQFMHSKKDRAWCNHCYTQLKDYIPLAAPHYKKIVDIRVQQGYTESYYVQSKTHSEITNLRNLWYRDGKKVLPFDSIYKHLTPLALAWWYQDDGHLKKKSNTPQKIILSTESFMPYENKELSHILLKKFRLAFAVDKQNRLILYDQFQIRYFLYLIEAYLHHSMSRKTITSVDLSSSQTLPKRTSIYLPIHINISSPTSEINEKLSTLSAILDLLKINSFYNKEIFDICKSFQQHKRKSYQIVISGENIQKLILLKGITGMNFSLLTNLCFQYGMLRKRDPRIY